MKTNRKCFLIIRRKVMGVLTHLLLIALMEPVKSRIKLRKRYVLKAAIVILVCCYAAAAQTTVFTYQGKLTDMSAAANGPYDFTFRLFDSVSGGSQIGLDVIVDDVPVSNGIFTVNLDFGAASFTNGAPRFLEISVRAGASTGAYTVLAPRQPVSSAPFAIKSLNSTAADGLSAACNLCVTDSHILSLSGNKLTGVISGDGSGITNINGGNIASQSVTSVQISPDSLPNTTPFKLLGSLRWDLLKGQNNFVLDGSGGIAFDGANMWIASNNSNNVVKLRVSDGTNLGTFPLSGRPQEIAFDGANIWTANRFNNNVTKLRTSDGAIVGTFAVGTGPLAIAFDGANIWTANFSSNNVTKLRASDGTNLGTFSVGSLPEGIVFDGANMWVSNAGDSTVTKLRATDGTNLGTFLIGSFPIGIAFDGANIWTANFSGNSVTKLRASDGTNLGTFPVGTNPTAVAFDGSNIWVANRNDTKVTKLRASDGANLGSFPLGSLQNAIAFDGANIWVANQNGVTRLPPAFP
jgi:outer membrane lipoprotein-sorting protein